MKIKILVVGKTKEKFIQQGEQEYLKRLRRYVKVEWVIAKPEKITANADAVTIKAVESKRIFERIAPRDYVVALHPDAPQLASEGLADYLADKMNAGEKTITFVIGGALGFDDDMLRKSDKILSLSKMTFTHEMVRMILLEQIYRAFTIIKGEKYHK